MSQASDLCSNMISVPLGVHVLRCDHQLGRCESGGFVGFAIGVSVLCVRAEDLPVTEYEIEFVVGWQEAFGLEQVELRMFFRQVCDSKLCCFYRYIGEDDIGLESVLQQHRMPTEGLR